MNSRAHFFSLFSAVCHLVIGLTDLFRIGPRFLPPSWAVLASWLPEEIWWIYPGLFTVTGLVALGGVRWPVCLRLGFQMSALCFLTWGGVGIEAYRLGVGGNIQGSAANLFTAGCAWVLSSYVTRGVRSDARDEQAVQLAEKLGVPVELEDRANEPPATGQ